MNVDCLIRKGRAMDNSEYLLDIDMGESGANSPDTTIATILRHIADAIDAGMLGEKDFVKVVNPNTMIVYATIERIRKGVGDECPTG